MSAPDNPSAFPTSVTSKGMTLRDYFAGKAITSVINTCRHDTVPDGLTLESYFAEKAGEIADAMLAERARAVQP